LTAFVAVAWVNLDSVSREASLERHNYEGRVTAIQSNETVTRVWLNSDQQIIKIYGSPTTLEVGSEYLIIVDENGKLINAVIVKR